VAELETGTPVEEGQVDDGQEPVSTRRQMVARRLMQGAVVLVLLALAGLAVAGLFEVWPDKVQEGTDPSWIDNVFASKTVVFGARVVLFSAAVVLFFGAAYTVLSIIHRIHSREWLREIGPFKISEQAISAYKEQIEDLQLAASAAEQEINSLRANLAETQGVADHFYELWANEIGLALEAHEGD
jgi:hypothetical protein